SDRWVTVGGNVSLVAQNGYLSFGDFANQGLEVQNALVTGDVTMNLGTGVANSALFGGGSSMGSTSAHSVTITGRGAHDTVAVGASTLGGNLAVSLTGQGANSISVDSASVAGSTTLSEVGGNNKITIDNLAPGSMFGGNVAITMNGRGNLLSINSQHRAGGTGNTTLDRHVSGNRGGGNDTLIVAEIGKVDSEGTATFRGGMGRDTALVNGGNLTGGQPRLINLR